MPGTHTHGCCTSYSRHSQVGIPKAAWQVGRICVWLLYHNKTSPLRLASGGRGRGGGGHAVGVGGCSGWGQRTRRQALLT